MIEEVKQSLRLSLQDFRMPRYQEIPGMGLYLEQVVKYICEALSPLQENAITGSMVSNYVKKGLIASPVKKQYSRDQIAYLMFIALAKNVLSLDHLQRFIRIQQSSYPTGRAYDYLCEELENMLGYVFGLKENPENIGIDFTDEKFLLRDTIVTIAHKIYLDRCFAALAEAENESSREV